MESYCQAAGELSNFSVYSIQNAGLVTFKVIILFLYAVNNLCINLLLNAILIVICVITQEEEFVYVLNCTEDTPAMIPLANAFSFAGIAVDLATVVADLWLIRYCDKTIRDSTIVLYNLLSISIRSYFPDIDYVSRKTAQGLVNFYPYYTFICPLFYVAAISRMKKSRLAEFHTAVRPTIRGKYCDDFYRRDGRWPVPFFRECCVDDPKQCDRRFYVDRCQDAIRLTQAR
ncbi:unnamed protein product, partial [Mesorhabditis spiculigera]